MDKRKGRTSSATKALELGEAPRYEVVVGINYKPDNRRAGPGSVVDDIPPKSISWLLEGGIIKPSQAPLCRIDDTAPQAFGPSIDTLAPLAPAEEE